MSENVKLREAVQIRNAYIKYRDEKYLDMIYRLNTQCQELLKDDLGSQFVASCGRDLAGEVIRNFFDTSDFFITVDQLAERMFKFTYANDIDPLRDNKQVHKNVYQYNDINSARLNRIVEDMDNSQNNVFDKNNADDNKLVRNGKKIFRKSREDGQRQAIDDVAGKRRDGADMDVDHVQPLAAAKYNAKYVNEKGLDEIKKAYNSEDNFIMMDSRANQVKNDVRIVINEKGETEYLISSQIKKREEKGAKFEDITHRATPEQYAEAIVAKWQNTNPKATQILKDAGYLNEDGTVPKHMKKKLVQYVKRAQNAESVIILKNAEYKIIGKDAARETAKSMGKIIAGQIIYYAAPPIFYEIKLILQNKPDSVEKVIDTLKKSGKRIVNYVLSNLKPMFANVSANALKNFIKIFMDILINLVKATIKKIIKLAKNLVLATVDAIRILVQKDSSRAEKADAVTNLFAVTMTTFAVDALFDSISAGLHIPDFLLMPLQILTTVICTNLTMLILQKVDLFDVRFGMKINSIRTLFENTADDYADEMMLAEKFATDEINNIIAQAEDECRQIYENLADLNPYETDVRNDLIKINDMFGMGVQFAAI
jgi:hypothetical protein